MGKMIHTHKHLDYYSKYFKKDDLALWIHNAFFKGEMAELGPWGFKKLFYLLTENPNSKEYAKRLADWEKSALL